MARIDSDKGIDTLIDTLSFSKLRVNYFLLSYKGARVAEALKSK